MVRGFDSVRQREDWKLLGWSADPIPGTATSPGRTSAGPGHAANAPTPGAPTCSTSDPNPLCPLTLPEIWSSPQKVRRAAVGVSGVASRPSDLIASPRAQHLAGCLRVASLYGPRIYLPVANVVDGVFFLAFGPVGCREMLGLAPFEPLPFVIGGNGRTLREAVMTFLCGKETPKDLTRDPVELSSMGSPPAQARRRADRTALEATRRP